MAGKRWLIISVFLLGMASTATGKIIFVDADANGVNGGSSWTDAYNYLQDGLTDANSAVKPVEIRVAEGIYTPDSNSAVPGGSGDREATFQLINGVTLKGSYAGFGEADPNARDIDAYETILNGDLNGNDVDVNDPADLLDEPTRAENSYHVVNGSETDSTAVLDGFIITGGNANSSGAHDSGAGMYNEYGSPTLTNCIFSGNVARFGGGMYNENSSPILNFCTFSENSTDIGGGGIYNYNSSPILTNCTFRGNRAKHLAGGMDGVQGSSPVLVKCTFSSNSAGYRGGGISHAGCSPVLSKCIFSGNSADNSGGGVYCHNSTNLTLNNCIFAKNKAPIGEAVACDSNREQSQNILKITNCILWDEGNEIWNNDGSTITISYTDLKGGQAACYDPCEGLVWGDGNINADPCFVSPGYWADANDPNIPVEPNDPNAVWVDGDYHLKSQAGRWDPNLSDWVIDANTSICIDAGNPGCPLGDEPNDPNNIRINMGAYGGTAEASKSPANWALLADLTNDRTVDFNDLKVFVDYWLDTGQCIPSDLNRSQSVDFVDFAIMALHWLRTSFVESIFDFAVATKGALNLQGNIEIGGASIFIDASVYIESRNDPNALDIIGNSHIAGDVFIINPDATVTLQGGQASIGGETAPEAYDHVFTGVPPTEFPVPEPNYFKHYVENTYDPNNVLAEYDNVIIPAGTNPSFGTVTFRGVVFIEAPNIVTFAGNTTITGIIVGNGDLSDNSGTNQICFTGTVDSYPVTDLPEETQFEQLRNETGTFLMAPGFSVSFSGNFETLNGAIAANGIEFFGNAGGTIDGSVLNYSNEPMTLSGNSDLFFNRSGTAQMPAGFD